MREPVASCRAYSSADWRPLNARQRWARLRVGIVLLLLALALPWSERRLGRTCHHRLVRRHPCYAAAMAAGSIVGTFIGGRLLGIMPSVILLPLLAGILIISAVKAWRHE